MSEPDHEDLHRPGAARAGRERLRALPAHRRAARAAEDARGAGPPRRAAVPDRPPVLGAVAEARVRPRSRRRRRALERGELLAPALRLLRRAVLCLQYVTTAARDARTRWIPWEYQQIRVVLGHGSGFDSPGLPRASPHATPAAVRRRSTGGSSRPGSSSSTLYQRGREHRGALPARRAADRLGRADLGLALSPLRDRRAGARRGHDRHAGHARAGARQADRPAPAAPSCGRRAAGWSSCSTPSASARRHERRGSGRRARAPAPPTSRSTSSAVL